jgi:hypothetical protein
MGRFRAPRGRDDGDDLADWYRAGLLPPHDDMTGVLTLDDDRADDGATQEGETT